MSISLNGDSEEVETALAAARCLVDNASEEEKRSVFEKAAKERFGDLFVKGLSWNQLWMWESNQEGEE